MSPVVRCPQWGPRRRQRVLGDLLNSRLDVVGVVVAAVDDEQILDAADENRSPSEMTVRSPDRSHGPSGVPVGFTRVAVEDCFRCAPGSPVTRADVVALHPQLATLPSGIRCTCPDRRCAPTGFRSGCRRPIAGSGAARPHRAACLRQLIAREPRTVAASPASARTYRVAQPAVGRRTRLREVEAGESFVEPGDGSGAHAFAAVLITSPGKGRGRHVFVRVRRAAVKAKLGPGEGVGSRRVDAANGRSLQKRDRIGQPGGHSQPAHAMPSIRPMSCRGNPSHDVHVGGWTLPGPRECVGDLVEVGEQVPVS